MSDTANWSYIADATLWPMTGRDKYGVAVYGAPVGLKCAFRDKVERMHTGELKKMRTYYTEYATAKTGDRIQLGTQTGTPGQDADEVLQVLHDQDVFGNKDDYRITT